MMQFDVIDDGGTIRVIWEQVFIVIDAVAVTVGWSRPH